MKNQFSLWVKRKTLLVAGKFFSWASFFSWGYVVLSLISFMRSDDLNAINPFYITYLFIINFIAPIPTFFPSPNILLAIGFMILSVSLHSMYNRTGKDFPLRIWIKRGCALVGGCALCLLPTFLMNPFVFWTLSLLGCLAMIASFTLLNLPTDIFLRSRLAKKTFYAYLLCGIAFSYLPIFLFAISIVPGVAYHAEINRWWQRVQDKAEGHLCLSQLCALMLFLHILTFVLWGDYEYIGVAASWILLAIIFMCVGRALAFLGRSEELFPMPKVASDDEA